MAETIRMNVSKDLANLIVYFDAKAKEKEAKLIKARKRVVGRKLVTKMLADMIKSDSKMMHIINQGGL
jgi:hypothetical protein